MKKQDLKEIIIGLIMVARRNETDWERNFPDADVREMRQIWNAGMSREDPDYWHEWQ